MSSFLLILDVVLIVIILAFVAVWLWNKIQTKRLGNGDLTNEEFNKGMRKAQVVDLREKAPFKRKHIDGARNLPYTMLKYQYTELRAIYLFICTQTLYQLLYVLPDFYKKSIFLQLNG